MKTMKKEETKQEELRKEKFNLQEAFVLWKNQSKTGNEYLKGKDLNNQKLVGYFNGTKKNPKEPDVRIYSVDSEGKQDKEVCSLWNYISTTGKSYLTGTTDEKEKIIAFYGNKEKAPYIKAYFKE